MRAPRTERYQSGAVAKLRAGEAPAGFAVVEKHFPSRRGDRVDHIYVGRDAATTEKLRALYGRDYARSIKEALRATGELVALSAAECAELHAPCGMVAVAWRLLRTAAARFGSAEA